VELSLERREIGIKLVYCGAAHSGKTTNLKRLHARAAAQSRGRLLSLDAQSDRTIFFDLLPLHFRVPSGDVTVRLRVYTVPGQPMHNATRRVVLQNVDGIVFVADSRTSEIDVTSQAFQNVKENLRENGVDPDTVPLVLQFNKRDLPDVRHEEELLKLESRGRPVVAACAARDEGVLRSFLAAVKLTWDDLDRRHGLGARFGVSPEELLAEVAALFGKRL
jgi:signal recognition particle receptor subunit beta